MLKLNAAPIFAASSIDKPNAFLRNNGFTANTASDVVTGKVKVLNLKRLEELCLLLNCCPHDLLEWVPDTKITEPKKFELSALIKEKKVVVLSEELRGLPLSKLDEIHKFIEEKKKESMQ